MAAAMTMIGISASFDSEGTNNWNGNQDQAIARHSKAAKKAEDRGEESDKEENAAQQEERGGEQHDERHAIRRLAGRANPWQPRVAASTTRKSRSPTPGKPAGNAENSLCSCIILRR